MKEYKQTKDHVYKFDSPFDFIDYLGEPNPGLASAETDNSASPWSGTKDYEAAKQVSFEGFDVSDVVATLSELEASFDSQDVGVVHDVQGAFVDVGAYMTGEPECMIDFVETERPNNAVKLVFDVCEGAGVSTKQMMNRAACLAGVVDYLEKQSVPTEVHLLVSNDFQSYYGSNSLSGVFIKVKEANERLNINLLTGVLHPGFFRRIYFNFVEKHYPKSLGTYGRAGIRGEKIDKLLKSAGFEDIENIIKADTVTTMGGFNTFESIRENSEKMIKQIDLKLNI